MLLWVMGVGFENTCRVSANWNVSKETPVWILRVLNFFFLLSKHCVQNQLEHEILRYIYLFIFIFCQDATLQKQTRNNINEIKYTIMLQKAKIRELTGKEFPEDRVGLILKSLVSLSEIFCSFLFRKFLLKS